jgi:hypothetical protein
LLLPDSMIPQQQNQKALQLSRREHLVVKGGDNFE